MSKKWLLSLALILTVGGSAFASEVVTEVIRMQKGGSDGPTLTAYVQKSGSFSLSADEITELETAGVPSSVIVAMLDKDDSATAAAAPIDADAAAPADQVADVADFNDALASYGTWSDDQEYGHVFTPKEAVDANWQPYVDSGTWVYSDQGWFWNSTYAWGWAPFHYGRWAHRDRWVWIPDTTWGPSWVSWRHNDNYYGWAPLTPRARFQAGVGFNFGANVDVSIGLGERDYYFVPSHSFMEGNLRSSGIRNEERTKIYSQTTVVNNYTVTNNKVVNQGIPVKTVSVATKRDIKPMSIDEHAGKAGEKGFATKVEGNKLEVYRPALHNKSTVPAADKRVMDKNAKTPVARTDAKVDARKAELANKVRERAKTEPSAKTPAAKAPETPAAKTAETPAAKTPETPAAKAAQERTPNANVEAERAKTEQAKTAREQQAETRKTENAQTQKTNESAREAQVQKNQENAREAQSNKAAEKAREAQERKTENARPAPERKAEPRAEPRSEPKAEPRETPKAPAREEPRTPAAREEPKAAAPRAEAPRAAEPRQAAPAAREEPKAAAPEAKREAK